jgi:hypothetical protein
VAFYLGWSVWFYLTGELDSIQAVHAGSSGWRGSDRTSDGRPAAPAAVHTRRLPADGQIGLPGTKDDGKSTKTKRRT